MNHDVVAMQARGDPVSPRRGATGPFAYARSMGGGHETWECTHEDAKLTVVARILRRRFGTNLRLLVVGCGDGTEPAVLADLLESEVVGVDVVDRFHPEARNKVDLVVADAMQLPFRDESFDLVFSFHALEHIPNAHAAVAEMRRVLREDGGVWIGTPNRSRLIGYLGTRDGSVRDVVGWNLADWRARLRGRFRNEFGAHAGFTSSELEGMIMEQFASVESDTDAYYELLYPRRRRLFDTLKGSASLASCFRPSTSPGVAEPTAPYRPTVSAWQTREPRGSRARPCRRRTRVPSPGSPHSCDERARGRRGSVRAPWRAHLDHGLERRERAFLR